MADTKTQNHQEEEHDGASPGEQLIEAARRNNVDLLEEILSACKSEEEAAVLLNDTKSVLGNHIYHEAALRGNYEIIDTLLDQPLFECDPVNRTDLDTPLHSAIRFINTLPTPLSSSNLEFASALLTMMTEAGSDPRIRNKAKLTPGELCDPRHEELKKLLEEAGERAREQGEEERELVGLLEQEGDDGEGEGVGSASDSDDEGAAGQRRR